MKKISYILAGASLLAVAGSVVAEPMTLSAAQLDGVNAGGVYLYQGAAIADAGAGAISNLLGLTGSSTTVSVQPALGYVTSIGSSGAVAVSNFNPVLGNANGAGAISGAASSSSLF